MDKPSRNTNPKASGNTRPEHHQVRTFLPVDDNDDYHLKPKPTKSNKVTLKPLPQEGTSHSKLIKCQVSPSSSDIKEMDLTDQPQDIEKGGDVIIRGVLPANQFMSKTFAGVSLCMAATLLWITIVCASDGVQQFYINNRWFTVLTAIFSILLILILYCAPPLSHRYPNNYCFLIAVVTCVTFCLGTVGAYVPALVLLSTIIVSAALSFLLAVYALKTRTDFTTTGGMISAGPVVLLFLVFLALTVEKAFHVFFALGFIMLFCVYIVFDVQWISGRRQRQPGLNDFVVAVLTVYVDMFKLPAVILIFIGGVLQKVFDCLEQGATSCYCCL